MQHIEIKTLQGINWTNYNLYCYRNGLNNGNFKNLKRWIETNLNVV